MLYAIEPFFCNGENDLAILNDRRRGIGVKHIQAQDQHG